MANPFDQFDEDKQPDVTVTRIGDREVSQPSENAFDSFDQAEEQSEQKPGVVNYLLNSVKRGVISSAAAFDALLNAGFSRVAAANAINAVSQSGVSPEEGKAAKEELMRKAYGLGEEPKPIIQAAAEAQAESMRKFAPLTGAEVDMRAPGPISRVVGAGIEAAFDPLSYIGGIGLVKTPLRAAGEFFR
jgi:hypothetical protein